MRKPGERFERAVDGADLRAATLAGQADDAAAVFIPAVQCLSFRQISNTEFRTYQGTEDEYCPPASTSVYPETTANNITVGPWTQQPTSGAATSVSGVGAECSGYANVESRGNHSSSSYLAVFLLFMCRRSQSWLLL